MKVFHKVHVFFINRVVWRVRAFLRMDVFQSENVCASDREWIYFRARMDVFQTENGCISERECVYFRERMDVLQNENVCISEREWM